MLRKTEKVYEKVLRKKKAWAMEMIAWS